MTPAFRVALLVLALTACGRNLDAAMWDCQLEVQKGNAGKSAVAAAERATDIESCMRERGYRLDAGNAACPQGATDSSCYRPM